MTNIYDETLAEWAWQDEQRAAARAQQAEQERQAVARVLSSRGQMAAAAVVAMSGWRTEDVGDNWNVELRAILAVPPEGVDAIDQALRDQLADAAGTVLGEGFTDLVVRVRLETAEPGWDAQLVARLREHEARDTAPTATPIVLELPPGSVDAS